MIPLQNIRDTYSSQRHTQNIRSLEHRTPSSNFRETLNRAVGNDNTPAQGDDTARTSGTEHQRPVDTRLMNTCVEMESLLVSQMLKAMRQTVHKNEMFHGGRAEEIFEDMLYDEYALQLSRTSNLGLARTMYDQLSRTR